MQSCPGPGLHLESHPLDAADDAHTSSPEAIPLEPEISHTSPTRRRSSKQHNQQLPAATASVDWADLVRDFNSLSARVQASEQELEQTKQELSRERQRARRLRASYDALALGNNLQQQHKGSSEHGHEGLRRSWAATQGRSSQHTPSPGKDSHVPFSSGADGGTLPTAMGPLRFSLLGRRSAAGAAASRYSSAVKDTAVADQGRSSSRPDTVADRDATAAAGTAHAAAAATGDSAADAQSGSSSVESFGSLAGGVKDAATGAGGSPKKPSPRKRTAQEQQQQRSTDSGSNGSNSSASGTCKKQALPQAVGTCSRQQPTAPGDAPLLAQHASGHTAAPAGGHAESGLQQQQQQSRMHSKRHATQEDMVSSDLRLVKIARRLSRAHGTRQAGAGADSTSRAGNSTRHDSSAAAAATRLADAADAPQQQEEQQQAALPIAAGFRLSLDGAEPPEPGGVALNGVSGEQISGSRSGSSRLKQPDLSTGADSNALALVAVPARNARRHFGSSRRSFDAPSMQHRTHAAAGERPFSSGVNSGNEPRAEVRRTQEPASHGVPRPAPQAPQPQSAAAPHAASTQGPQHSSGHSSSHNTSKGSKWSAATVAKAMVGKVRRLFAGMGSSIDSSNSHSTAGGPSPFTAQGVGSNTSARSGTGGGGSSRGEGGRFDSSRGSSRFEAGRRQDADFRRSWQGPFFSSGAAAARASEQRQQESARRSKDDLHAGGSWGAKRWLRSRLKWARKLGGFYGSDSDSSDDQDDAVPVYEEDPFGDAFSPLRANFRQKFPQHQKQGQAGEGAAGSSAFSDPFGPAFSPLRQSMQFQPGGQPRSSKQGQSTGGVRQGSAGTAAGAGAGAASKDEEGFGPGWLGID